MTPVDKSHPLSDGKLTTIRHQVSDKMGDAWDAEYGDAAWEAALAVAGLGPMKP